MRAPVTVSRKKLSRKKSKKESINNIAPDLPELVTRGATYRTNRSFVGWAPEEQLGACQSTIYSDPSMSVEGMLSGADEYNRVIRDVVRETGVILVEGENAIPGDDRRFDWSFDFKDPGARIMAQPVVTVRCGRGLSTGSSRPALKSGGATRTKISFAMEAMRSEQAGAISALRRVRNDIDSFWKLCGLSTRRSEAKGARDNVGSPPAGRHAAAYAVY